MAAPYHPEEYDTLTVLSISSFPISKQRILTSARKGPPSSGHPKLFELSDGKASHEQFQQCILLCFLPSTLREEEKGSEIPDNGRGHEMHLPQPQQGAGLSSTQFHQHPI